MSTQSPDSEHLVEQLEAIWAEAARTSSVMPSEPQLAAATGASRPSIREALVRLEERGYVHRSQGARTIINRRLAVVGVRVDRQRDHSVSIAEAGYQASMQLISSEIAVVAESEASFHDLPPGTRVALTRKVWSANGERYVLADDVVPIMEPNDSPSESDLLAPVFDLAERFNGVNVAWETVWFKPVLLGDDEREILGVVGSGAALELTYCGVGPSDDVAYWSREIQIAPPDRLVNSLVRRVSH